MCLLSHQVTREIPYARDPRKGRVLIYSDADGSGNIAAVLLMSDRAMFFRARIPRELCRQLKRRVTNIVAFELIAAVIAILTFSV